MSQKAEIEKLLQNADHEGLIELAGTGKGIYRTLISMAYDRENVLSWRAIEAVGIIAGAQAKTDSAGVRNLLQRLLWMLREESGNNPWSAPDMIGEIIINSPDEFSDIAPILASFHEETILHRGVLRAVSRIAHMRPDLVASSAFLSGEYLHHPDAALRIYAIRLAGSLGLKQHLKEIEELAGDCAVARIYEDGELREVVVSEEAEVTIRSFSGKAVA